MKGKKIVSFLVSVLIVLLICFSTSRICGEIAEMESYSDVSVSNIEFEEDSESSSYPILFDDPAEEVKKEYIGRFLLTAYCPCEKCTDGDGITATGIKPTEGRTIAVDPTIIPYGTEIIIDGISNTRIAEDCGGSIKCKRIDVYFENHQEAIEFGVKERNVFILKNQ